MPESEDFNGLEILFLALNDKTRLRLLALMADGPVVVGLLAERLGESQPKISRHLAYMRNAGVVYTKREGKWIYYGIQYPEDISLRRILQMVVRSIAAISEDNERAFIDDATVSDDNIYALPDINDEILEIVGPADEEVFYENEGEADEMEVFLL